MSHLSSRSAFVIAALSVFAGLLAGTAPLKAQVSLCLARYERCEALCLQARSYSGWERCHTKTCRPMFNRCVIANESISEAPTYVAAPRVHFPHDRGGPGPVTPPGPAKPPSNPTGPIVPDGRVPPPGAGNGNGGVVPPHLPRGGIVSVGQGGGAPSSDKK